MRARSAWFAPERPRLIAHRGLAVAPDGTPVVPENTLEAFRRALDAGATHLETDARATADGVAVLWHDPDLARVGGSPAAVAELTLERLSAIDLGGGARVCTLAEALAALPEARFNIDVKSADAVVPTAAAIRDAGAQQRVLVTSFSRSRRLAALRALGADVRGGGDVATSASAGATAVAIVAVRLRITPLARAVLSRVDALQLPPVYGPLSTSTPATIRRLHRAGVEVHYWTVNDPAEMRRLLDAGADAVISDRVDLAVREVDSGAG